MFPRSDLHSSPSMTGMDDVPPPGDPPRPRSPPTSADADACDAEELPVTVALMIRPLVGPELVDGCQTCVFPDPGGEPSVTLVSDHKFTYDRVFHGPGATDAALYEQCVEPLVTGLLGGYNATVLAYGQTGSGKTHVMGTTGAAVRATAAPTGTDETHLGVIPRVVTSLFRTVADLPPDETVALSVGFIEIHKEDIRDLLNPKGVVSLRDAPGGAGGVQMVGASARAVRSAEEMARALRDGSASRATAATGMNHRSSRSHAIFTIHVERRGAEGGVTRSKMHLVDLAGSERAKRTKAEGARLKEGIQINKGLLALGNVISALGDDKRRFAGGHVPYRDSKLTRLLQDSLGGNSRTVMVACISPADANLDETLNTLKYANRARNIVNKATVGVETDERQSEQVAKLRRMLAAARAEVAHLKLAAPTTTSSKTLRPTSAFAGAHSSAASPLEAMEARAMIAEAEASRLRADLRAAEEAARRSAETELAATVQRDALALKIEDAGVTLDEDESSEGSSRGGVIRGYLSTIQALRNEQSRLKQQLAASQEGRPDPWAEDPAASYDDSDDADAGAPFEDEDALAEDEDEPALDLDEDAAGDELRAELASVERALRAKEAAMASRAAEASATLREEAAAAAAGEADASRARPSSDASDVEAVREKYGRLLASLDAEKAQLAAERDDLVAKLASAAKQDDAVRREVEAKHRGRLAELESRLKEVRRLAAAHREAARRREESELAAETLRADIQRLRAARVDLIRRVERATKEGIAKQREVERSAQAARKEGRRHALEAQKAKRAVDRQAAVLRRKTEEAASAREQLRALQAAAKANAARRMNGVKNAAQSALPPARERRAAASAPPGSDDASDDRAGPGTGLGLAARKAWLDAEVERAVERAELRGSLEESLAHRAALGRRFPHLAASPGKARSASADASASDASDVVAVEEEMRAVTEQIAMLQERVYRCEEREELKGGPRRWARVRSLGEARSLLTILFAAAASWRRRAGREGRVASPATLYHPPSAPETLGVLAEADAVLDALKKKPKARPKRKAPKARPAWQSVGPSTLAPEEEGGGEGAAGAPSGDSAEAEADILGGGPPSAEADILGPPSAEADILGPPSASASPQTSSSSSLERSASLDSASGDSERTPERDASAAASAPPVSELLTTCRDARRRAEGLLFASGGEKPPMDGDAAWRSPLGDVSNANSDADDVRRRVSFGGNREVEAGAVGGGR